MNQTETSVAVSQSVFAIFDAISLLASIASLILAMIAIWLAIAFKRDSDKVNKDTSDILIEIKSESKAISQGVMSELKAYGDTMRGNIVSDNTYSATPSNFKVSM